MSSSDVSKDIPEEKDFEKTGEIPVVSEKSSDDSTDETKVLPPTDNEPTTSKSPATQPEPDTHDSHETATVAVNNEGADRLTKSTIGRTYTLVCLALAGLAGLGLTQFAGSGAMARHYVLTFFVIFVVAAGAHVVAHFFRELVTFRRTRLSKKEQEEVRDDAIMAGIVLSIVFTLMLAIVFFSSQAVWVFVWLVGNDMAGQAGVVHEVSAEDSIFLTILKIILIAFLVLIALKRLRDALLGDGSHVKAIIMFVGALIIGILAIVWLTPVVLMLIAGVSGVIVLIAMPLVMVATAWLMLKRTLTVWSLILAITAGLLWFLPLGWSTAVVLGI